MSCNCGVCRPNATTTATTRQLRWYVRQPNGSCVPFTTTRTPHELQVTCRGKTTALHLSYATRVGIAFACYLHGISVESLHREVPKL